MDKKTVKVSNACKMLLDTLKEKYSYKTYEQCLHEVAKFVIDNDIDPTDSNLGNFKNSLVDIEMRLSKSIADAQKKLNADNVSLRKWVGAIERDYFVPIKSNLEGISKFVDLNTGDNIQQKSNENRFENPINVNLPKTNLENTDDGEKKELYQKLLDKSSEINELDLQMTAYKKTLEKIINASRIEQGGMLSKEKIIIEMSVEDWELLIKNK